MTSVSQPTPHLTFVGSLRKKSSKAASPRGFSGRGLLDEVSAHGVCHAVNVKLPEMTRFSSFTLGALDVHMVGVQSAVYRSVM